MAKSKGKDFEKEIQETREKLEKFKAQRANLDRKIKVEEQKLQELALMNNSKKFAQLADVLGKAGLSFEDVVAALGRGDKLEDMMLSTNRNLEEETGDVSKRDEGEGTLD